MINFKNDYNIIAHNKILEAMLEYNKNTYVGYGLDELSEQAANAIKKHINNNVDIHFLVGGTQTNVTVIDAALRAYQGAVCAETGHINVHETGAIEATGHKVLAIEGKDGKLSADQILEQHKLHRL